MPLSGGQVPAVKPGIGSGRGFLGSLGSGRGQDRQGFHRSATNPLHFAIVCLSAHILPQRPYMLPHAATFCHMLP